MVCKFSPFQRQDVSADRLQVQAATPLLDFAKSKQDPINNGCDAQYLYRTPSARASEAHTLAQKVAIPHAGSIQFNSKNHYVQSDIAGWWAYILHVSGCRHCSAGREAVERPCRRQLHRRCPGWPMPLGTGRRSLFAAPASPQCCPAVPRTCSNS